MVDFQQALHRLPERMPPPAKPESISIAQAFYCLLHLANEPPALGTKWTNVGRERPASGTELFNEALSAALRKKHEFSKEEVEKFKVGLLKVDCFIKVGEEYFEEAGQRHAVELVGHGQRPRHMARTNPCGGGRAHGDTEHCRVTPAGHAIASPSTATTRSCCTCVSPGCSGSVIALRE